MARSTYRQIITSPENWAKVNEKNIKLMNMFLKEKNTRASDTTIEGYRSDLSIFFTWNLLENDNKFYIDIKKMEFAEFFSYCVTELKWGSAKFSRTKSCLSSLGIFIERLLDDQYPEFRNIINKSIESMPKVEAREKTILTDEHILKLTNYLKEKERTQELCWLYLALSSGARFSEILRFTTDLIDENNVAYNGLFLETLKSVKSKGRGKAGHMVTKFIVKDLFLPYYKKWLIERERVMNENNQNHNSLFIRDNGSPAHAGTIRSWLKKYEGIMGVPFYPHAARHQLVTHLSKIGLSSELIVSLLGWKSESMYKIYNDMTSKDKSWKELDKLEEHLKNSGIYSQESGTE